MVTAPGPTLMLLGSPRLVAADGAAVAIGRRKELALLAYLAVECARPQPRERLLGLLWPESRDEEARLGLRVALARLRGILGDTDALTLMADRRAVQLTPRDERWLDVLAFNTLLANCRAHSHDRDAPCAACTERLAQAVDLYRGDFLAGLVLPDAAPFEEWALLRREELHRHMLDALAGLAARYEQAGDYTALCRHARRQLELEPWHEPAHRQLMRGLAMAGDRGAALVQYEACRQVLADELGVEPEVATRALYERLKSGDLAPASRDAATPRHNLPAPLTPLVGREHDLAELAVLLRQEDVRLLTLLGAGGMGKTRLALELARASLDGYADGVYFVSLAPLAGADGLASAISQALSLLVQGDDPAVLLVRFLREKHLLLILDNFEHLLAGTALVVEILQAAPHVRIVTTSRTRLHVRGEFTFVVEGLEHPPDAGSAGAATSPAVLLFARSARRAQTSFTLRRADLPAVVRICQLVQGMPLALEMAAAWAEMLPLEEVAAEIARSADFLSADFQDLPVRQRSMRAVFEWSWSLLSASERSLFCRLSVFRGGCTRQAAENIAGASLGALTSLVQKSLLRRMEVAATGMVRYEIHELLRQLAAEQLAAVPDEREAVAARHGAFYLEFVAARERRLARDEPREAVTEIRGELDNIRQAWTWAATHAEAALLEHAAYGWWQSCLLNGLEQESRQLFGLAAQHVREALDHFSEGQPGHEACRRALSVLLAIHANHLFSHVPYDQMADQAREAMQLGAASGSLAGEAIGSYVLGRALKELGRQREAQSLWEQTIALAKAEQHQGGAAEILHEAELLAYWWQFGAFLFFNDYAAGRACVEAAVQLCQALRKRRGELFSLSSLAMIDFYTGDDVSAQRRYEQVIALARALDDRWAEMRIQRELSEVLRVQGAYAEARALLEGVVTVARELGIWYEEFWAVAALVRLHCQVGVGGGAWAWRDQLTPLMERVGLTPDSRAAGLRAGALFALATGDLQQALGAAEKGLELTLHGDIPNFRAEAAVILGHVHAGLQQWSVAESAYEQALSWYATCGNATLAREPQAGLAQIALATGDLDRASVLVEALVPGLAAPPRASVLTPAFADLVCYRVLEATHDPRVGSVLQAARERLHRATTQFDSPERRPFLERVVEHRVLLRAGKVADPPIGASAEE